MAGEREEMNKVKDESSKAEPVQEDQVESDHADHELDDFSMSSDEEIGSHNHKLDKAMMNELLLVCSNLGMLRVEHEGEEPIFVRGEDCEEWIHDLQRAIRRDHAKHKLVAKQLGKWKILQKKLLPLLLNHHHDWSLVFAILKILVMLTMKPPRDSSNIAEQLQYLREYKHSFLRSRIMQILISILVDPLEREGPSRSSQDYLNMELVLTLIRNLLAIPNEDSRLITSCTEYLSHLQEDFIGVLYEENVYELILLFCQDIDSTENREWNLLIMEIIDLTLDVSTPQSLIKHLKQSNQSKTQEPTNSALSKKQTGLLQQIHHENKVLSRGGLSQRHSNFGGILSISRANGKTRVLTDFSKSIDERIPQPTRRPHSKRQKSRQKQQIFDINQVFGSKVKAGTLDNATMSILVLICDSILGKSYFQLMTSLKTEFRRGSSKLVASDRLQYFHLVWFLTTYHRAKIQHLKSAYNSDLKKFANTDSQEKPNRLEYQEKAILSTLDMFSFNFVLQSIENYAEMKNYHGVTCSVKLLSEMMGYLSDLIGSDDLRLQRIADSLQHKIFYERDFLDRLPLLLKIWSPGTFSKDYVEDVVTLVHLVFKALDNRGTIKVLSRRRALERSKAKGDQGNNEESDEEESERNSQLVIEMQRKESEFDVHKYFSTIISNDTIKMYTFLLENYRDNSPKVNHYIHSFFYRVKFFKIYKSEEWTMEPMLFNIRVLGLFHKMLHDKQIIHRPEHKHLLEFIRGVVKNFFILADKNHLLFVEVFLRQSFAGKACALLQRKYASVDVHFRTIREARAQAVALGREKHITMINEVRYKRAALDAEELDGEAEFNFEVQAQDLESSSLVRVDKGSDETGDQCDAANSGKQVPKAVSSRAKNWTKVEDRYLKKMYQKYRHLPSVFELLSYEDMFQDRDRTTEQIERRVKFLKLHNSTYDSASDEDVFLTSTDTSEGLEVNKSYQVVRSNKRRRLRRGAVVDDESSDEENELRLLQRGPDSSVPMQYPDQAMTEPSVSQSNPGATIGA